MYMIQMYDIRVRGITILLTSIKIMLQKVQFVTGRSHSWLDLNPITYMYKNVYMIKAMENPYLNVILLIY